MRKHLSPNKSKTSSGRFFRGDPVVVPNACFARSPEEGGSRISMKKGSQGTFDMPIDGDETLALVTFQSPAGNETQQLEISLLDIDHVVL